MLPKNPKIAEREDGEKDKATGPEPDAPAVPSIFEAPAKGGNARLVVENGYGPAPSPDGHWITFFTKPSAGDDSAEPVAGTPPTLHLYDRERNQRFVVGSSNVNSLRWTPDSRSLIIVDATYGAGEVEGEARISLLNPVTLKSREVAALHARDFEGIGKAIGPKQFEALKLSNDGRFLFVTISEFTGRADVFYTQRLTLQAVNLSTGSVFTVARIEDPYARVLGWDWHDESG